MSRQTITGPRIADHVKRLGDLYPPIPLDSVDRTINNPELVRSNYSHVLEYLARVELEVDRNVLELLVLMPDVDETNRMFYADVWQPQEIQHGLILDRLQQDLDMPAAQPHLDVSPKISLLGALAHLRPIRQVAKLLYYLTGASTERQAVLAYNQLHTGLAAMGERAIAETIIRPIKHQEPGHFAFYRMSAQAMVQNAELKDWQLFLVRVLRQRSYGLVGTNGNAGHKTDMGAVIMELGLEDRLVEYAREIGRVESRLLGAERRGLDVPPYILRALHESLELYREREVGRRG